MRPYGCELPTHKGEKSLLLVEMTLIRLIFRQNKRVWRVKLLSQHMCLILEIRDLNIFEGIS
jgi:hypothetical protein